MPEEIYSATGRRKAAVARVRLGLGDGTITINNKPADEYLGRESLLLHVNEPLETIEGMGKYTISARVNGGGVSGQAGAIRLGIARALILMDPEMRPPLKSKGFLTRDARVVERKKYGQPGARKRFQFSKR
jgi:small subunit ribosomal protein S9